MDSFKLGAELIWPEREETDKADAFLGALEADNAAPGVTLRAGRNIATKKEEIQMELNEEASTAAARTV